MFIPSFARPSTGASIFLSRYYAPISALVLVIALGSASSRARAQTAPAVPTAYTITNLGALPDDTFSEGYAINASGDVAGTSQTLTGQPHAVLFKAGIGSVQAINDKGQITGLAVNPEGNAHAYLLTAAFVHARLDPALQLIGTPATTFVAGGSFTPDANGSAIDPGTQTVVLQLNGYHIAVPPNSFVKTNGTWVYNGKIGNVALGMVIRPIGGNVYLFGTEGIGAAGLPSSYPVQMTLTIGGFTGTDQIQSAYNGPVPTAAELCQYFHLDCGK